MAKRPILSVNSIQLTLMKSDPPQLLIVAHGYASNSGWSNAAIELIDPKSELSPDGVLDFNFVAEPPTGISLAVLTPVTASFAWTKDANNVAAVRVVSRTNEKSQLVNQTVFTTLALGEETPIPRWPPRTWPIGEDVRKFPWVRETPPTPWFGEHWPPTDPRIDDPAGSPFGDDGVTDPIQGRSPFGG